MPKNQEGQAPTRNADETEARLQEKERSQRGAANKERTEQQIDEIRSRS
jgi:hypothetical protein